MLTIPSIRTSIENKNVLVLDEHAKNGTFKRDAKNRLIAYTGGFSVVFPYETTDGKTWAFRCWHSDISNSKKRYETIAKYIRKAQFDFLCDFDYIEKGINVDGVIYPTTRMRWIDGITIKDYIYQNKDSKKTLTVLAENFLKMAHALHEKSLAHGDLQHGNILVDLNHNLHLVDYDSFYCPKLKGEADTVIGLPDYQHPSRTGNKPVTEKIDYFSELIIYISILAIAENPSLADKYKIKDADRLLFSKNDFADLKNSDIYKDIHSLGESFQKLLLILNKYLQKNDINELNPFDKELILTEISFKSSHTKVVKNEQPFKLIWNSPKEATVSLVQVGKNKPLSKQTKGEYNIPKLQSDATFKLITTVNGYKIVKKIIVCAVDEAEIEFIADKYYVFPSIPFTLKWNIKNAEIVWLNDEKVDNSGARAFEISKTTEYQIKVKDAFGIKAKTITIQMLPVPRITSILVPTPNIKSSVNINVKQHKLNVSVPFNFSKKSPTFNNFDAPLVDLSAIQINPPSVNDKIKNVIKNLVTKLTNKYK